MRDSILVTLDVTVHQYSYEEGAEAVREAVAVSTNTKTSSNVILWLTRSPWEASVLQAPQERIARSINTRKIQGILMTSFWYGKGQRKNFSKRLIVSIQR